jgi:SulP family sulfate permease
MSRKKSPALNLLAPLSVAIVVVTLGAAFGVLTGRGATLGMVSATIIALTTALIGGSRYGVSSPTGPMTAAIAVILVTQKAWLAEHVGYGLDSLELMNLTLLLAAVVLIAFVAMRVHKLVSWIPNLVVTGFVNGIAVLIALAQFRAIETQLDWALMGVTFLVALALSRFGKRFTHLAWQLITGSLFVIVGMSLVVAALGLPVSSLAIEASILDIRPTLPPIASIDLNLLWLLFPLALELALIALLDTLLTSVIMDQRTPLKTNHARELTGQSFSLFFVSLIGGVPGAQSTVPSIMLLEENGHHRLSKLFIGLFCLILTIGFAPLIQFVPLAVFGGVVLKIAVDVADFTAFKTLLFKHKKHHRWAQLMIVIGTFISTVLLSLNMAVISFTILFVLWNHIVPKRLRIPDLDPQTESEGLIDEL